MLKSLELQNVGPSKKMNLDFGSRLNIITGDNGLGKSFLLDVAWWSLTRRWPHDLNPKLTSGYAAKPTDVSKPATIKFTVSGKERDVTYTSKYAPKESAWLGRSGRPWNPGLVIYAHADGGFSVWDPARNYWKTKGNVDIQERLPGYVFSQKDVWDGLQVEIDGRSINVCNGIIRDWTNWILAQGKDAIRMASALESLSPSSEKLDLLVPGALTRPFVDDVRDIPSIRMPYGIDVPVVYASSGIRRIIALSYMLMWSWREHAIAAHSIGEKMTQQVTLLIDEVESHLHPKWQRSILSSILTLAELQHKDAVIQLIAATHSPMILASAEPIFDSDVDRWFDLDLDIDNNGKQPSATLKNRQFVKHGDISNWLTSEAFDLKSARSREAEIAIEHARLILRTQNGPNIEEIRKVDQELRAAGLPDIDPFWVRWSAYVESKES